MVLINDSLNVSLYYFREGNISGMFWTYYSALSNFTRCEIIVLLLQNQPNSSRKIFLHKWNSESKTSFLVFEEKETFLFHIFPYVFKLSQELYTRCNEVVFYHISNYGSRNQWDRQIKFPLLSALIHIAENSGTRALPRLSLSSRNISTI